MNKFFLPEKDNEWMGYKNLRGLRSEIPLQISAYLEKLWEQWQLYADSHFRSECQQSEEKFHQRFWEMYLGTTLINQGKLVQTNSIGPDLTFIENHKKIWIEAIAPSSGKPGNPNSVPPLVYEEIKYCPNTGKALPLTGRGGSLADWEHPIRLRYSSAIQNKYCSRDKSKKRRGIIPYLAKGVIQREDPVIIAINSGNIDQEDPNGLMPVIQKVCYGFGDYEIHLAYNRQDKKVENRGTSYTRKELAYKVDKEHRQIQIDSAVFLTKKYPYIGAILFSYAKLSRLPFGQFCQNFILIHNPFAKNSVARGLFQNCEDIWLDNAEFEDGKIVDATVRSN